MRTIFAVRPGLPKPSNSLSRVEGRSESVDELEVRLEVCRGSFEVCAMGSAIVQKKNLAGAVPRTIEACGGSILCLADPAFTEASPFHGRPGPRCKVRREPGLTPSRSDASRGMPSECLTQKHSKILELCRRSPQQPLSAETKIGVWTPNSDGPAYTVSSQVPSSCGTCRTVPLQTPKEGLAWAANAQGRSGPQSPNPTRVTFEADVV